MSKKDHLDQGEEPRIGRAFVVHNRKGGVGKSTLATHLAVYLQTQGRAVILLDLDARQADSFDFCLSRKEKYPDLAAIEAFEPKTPDEVGYYVDNAKAAGVDVVIDCPPADSDLALAAVDVGSCLLTPFKAGGNDARAVGRVLRMVAQPGMTQPKLLAIINEFKPRNIDDRNLLSLLQAAGIFTFCGVLGQRKEFKQTVSQAQTVWELAPDSAAAQEALAVCGQIDRAVQA